MATTGSYQHVFSSQKLDPGSSRMDEKQRRGEQRNLDRMALALVLGLAAFFTLIHLASR
jgi:hypothetical protein